MSDMWPDFAAERSRHLVFFERKDLFAHIDHLLCEGEPWIVVTGGPGTGKSAILANYLLRLETAQMGGHLGWIKSWLSGGTKAKSPLGDLSTRLATVKAHHGRRLVPHHFIRYRFRDWALPLSIEESLLHQIAFMFPKLVDASDRSAQRVPNLLKRIASDELAPHHKRLVLVVDGFDQIEGDNAVDPIFNILPPELPDGITVLCSARPTQDGLSPLAKAKAITIDLDAAEWGESSDSVRQACVRSHVEKVGTTPDYLDSAVKNADGNLRYLVELLNTLAENPRAPVDRPAPEFLAYLDEIWRFVTRFTDRRTDVARSGLAALSGQCDWTTLPGLTSRVAWTQPGDADLFLRTALPVLSTDANGDAPAYRIFHPSFGEYVRGELYKNQVAFAFRAMTGVELSTAPETAQSIDAKPITKRYAVVIGVDQYVEGGLALRYCVNDAQAVQQRLAALQYSTVAMDDKCESAEQHPSLFNIRAGLAKLKGRLQPEELLLVYFAGHGLLVDGKAYLMASDSRSAAPAETALPLADVETYMRASGSQRMLLIIDACHAGVDIGRDGKPPTNGIDPRFLHNAYELAEGFAVLAGSTAAQRTQDFAAKQHGVFTYFLLEALSSSADRGASPKGFVTVDDLKTYVIDAVRTWCFQNMADLQLPTARVEGTGDMIVAYLNPASGAKPSSPT